jgi:hypothetical protein
VAYKRGRGASPGGGGARVVTLVCAADGARVEARAGVFLSLGVLRALFDSDAAVHEAATAAAAGNDHDAHAHAPALPALPALPVAGPQLALLLAFLDAAPGAGLRADDAAAAVVEAGADKLEAQLPEADAAASLPLLRLLLAADALDAPRGAAWAAAVAAARALRREGDDAHAAAALTAKRKRSLTHFSAPP